MSALTPLQQRYGAVADAYARWWAPALLTFSQPVLDELREMRLVVDLGCGVGTLGRAATRAGARVVGIDVTEQMLRVAHDAGLDVVQADARRVPFAAGTVDAVVSTFVLQHISDPAAVASGCAHILREGGLYITATWGLDPAERGGVYDLLERIFDKHGIPQDRSPIRTWHDQVDTPEKVEAIARAAGFAHAEARAERMTYDWPPDAFVGWATSMGLYGRRLASANETTRAAVMADLRAAIDPANADDLRWEPEVVVGIARR